MAYQEVLIQSEDEIRRLGNPAHLVLPWLHPTARNKPVPASVSPDWRPAVS